MRGINAPPCEEVGAPEGLGPAEGRERMTLEGHQTLGAGVLGVLAVMA